MGFGGKKKGGEETGRFAMAMGKVSFWLVLLLVPWPLPCAAGDSAGSREGGVAITLGCCSKRRTLWQSSCL